MTRRAGVLGSPISHSLSPVLHRAAYAELGLTGWEYNAHECGEADLLGFVTGLGDEWVGLSLTMPLKRVALDVATDVTPTAAAIGAANTLILTPGRRLADNTDAPGLRDALAEAGWKGGGSAVIVGAGGTAQAAVAALADSISPGSGGGIVAVARNLARTTELVDTARRLGVAIDVLPWEQLPDVVAEAGLVVSTVPAPASPKLRDLPWRADGLFFDALYHPWPTPAAEAASGRGCTVVPGSALLLHQAAHQVARMTGRTAPLAAMREALAACFST